MQSFAVFLCAALPWLNPFAFGPAPPTVQWLFTLACCALLLPAIWRVPLAKVLASAWLAAALLSAAMGLLQYFGVAAIFRPWINTGELGEAFANLRQRNQFATLSNIGLAALLWWNARYALRPAARHWQTAVIVAAVLLALGNAASSSRTGLLQLLLLLAMAWVWQRPSSVQAQSGQWPVLLTAALAYVVAAFALPALAGLDSQAGGVLARLQNGDPLCVSRMTLWSNVLHLIAQKPWFGWGWGELGYAHFVTLYPGERFCDILDNAHNLPLHLAVELGVPMSAALCATGAWLIWRTRPWRETDATRRLAWAVLALVLMHSMLEYPLWYGPFQMAFGLSLLLLWQPTDRPLEKVAGASGPLALVSAMAALVLLAAVACAAWDYRRISQIYQTPEMRAPAYREDTLAKIGNSWLFQNQVRFAELTVSTVTPGDAKRLHDMAAQLLHFSSEPRVIEKIIESAALLGLEQERQFYLLRYQAAFPQSHALWLQENSGKAPDTAELRLPPSAP